MKLLIYLALLLCLLTFSAAAQKTIQDVKDRDDLELITGGTFPERSVVGKVIAVYDGDDCTVLDKNNIQYKFRLNAIDAPEFDQDFGVKSKKNLSDLILGKEVTIVFGKVDFYGRYAGKILLGGADVNLEQIKAGFAWHYKKYADEQPEADRKTYAEAEVKAREAKKGLWEASSPMPPWDFRSSKTIVRGTESKESKSVESVKKSSGRTYILGPRGGCYYINDGGNKVYVKDKSLCEN